MKSTFMFALLAVLPAACGGSAARSGSHSNFPVLAFLYTGA